MAPSRQRWIFFALVGAILLALPLGYFLFLADEEAPHPSLAPPSAELPKVHALILQKMQGAVEIRHGGGDWKQAAGGEALGSSDSVRTQDGAAAVLEGDSAYEIALQPSTEISVDEL